MMGTTVGKEAGGCLVGGLVEYGVGVGGRAAILLARKWG